MEVWVATACHMRSDLLFLVAFQTNFALAYIAGVSDVLQMLVCHLVDTGEGPSYPIPTTLLHNSAAPSMF